MFGMFLSALIVSWAFTGWLAVHDHKRIKLLEAEIAKYNRETVIEHNVAILFDVGNGDFAYQSDEEPNGGAFRPCPGEVKNGLAVPDLLKQAVSYIADYAIWEERGNCKSILRADQGFWFLDKHNNFTYRRIANGSTE